MDIQSKKWLLWFPGGFRKLVMLCILSSSLLLVSCARVEVEGNRADTGGPVHVGHLYVYSFLSFTPSTNKRLLNGLKGLNTTLAETFQERGVVATVEDAKDCALRNNLSYNTAEVSSLSSRGGYYAYKSAQFIPVEPIITANRDTERRIGATERLVLFPAATNTYASSGGNVRSNIAWVLTSTADNKLIATGNATYLADL